MPGNQPTRRARLRLLGPLALSLDGHDQQLGGPRQRAVLALLALEANRPVSVARIIDELWQDDRLRQPRNNVQVYVSNLRRILRPSGNELRIVGEGNGYTLAAADGTIDLVEFRAIASQGRRQAERGLFDAAVACHRSALDLWYGRFLDDLATEFDVFSLEAQRLDAELLDLHEQRNAAELESGHPGRVLPELESLVKRYPLHERFWTQLVAALAQCGRPRDALAAFQRARAVLNEEAGLDPGPELRQMEQAVLVGEPVAQRPRRSGSFLQFTDAGGTVRFVPLQPGSLYTIGRHDSADIPLDWDAKASRIHARLASAEDGWTLTDAGSTNGTFCRGDRIDGPVVVRSGDVFVVGATAIVLRSSGDHEGLAWSPSDVTILERPPTS